MASKKLFTAQSSRRFIKEECFSSFVSQKRIRSLQESLHDGGKDSDKPDALLCVTGIDSMYNEGCQELASYLLFGFFSERMRQIEAAGFEEGVIEDVMFVVKRKSVEVYCNPFNYPLLLPYIAPWRNLRLHCMTKEDYDGDEKSETFKIQSFLAMVDGCKKIGVPYSCSNRYHAFDVMAVEKWPIVQSHALTDVSSGTFFTLKYEVVDYSAEIHEMYQELDAVVFESIITDQLGNLETQWTSLIQLMELKKYDLGSITGALLAQPIVGFFKHGQHANDSQKPDRKPFVLIGSDTRKSKLEASPVTGTSSEKAIATNGKVTTHMICQIVSSKNPLGCRRTFFFSAGNNCTLAEDYGATKTPSNDSVTLIAIYQCCVKAVRDVIEIYKDVQDPTKLQLLAKKILVQTWIDLDLQVGPSHISNKDMFEFSIEVFNNANQSVPFTQWSIGSVKTITLSVFDIPSVEQQGQVVGSVSFSESFIDSCVKIQHPDDTSYYDFEVLNLTSQVEDFVILPFSSSESHVAEKLRNLREFYNDRDNIKLQEKVAYLRDDLGECLVGGENAHCIVQHTQFKTTGKLFVLEKAVVFAAELIGSVCIPIREICKIRYFDGDSPSAVKLLIIDFSESLLSFLPVPLKPVIPQIVLAFDPKSKADSQFFSHVLPVWKEATSPEFERIEALPEEWEEMYAQLQKNIDIILKPAQNASVLKRKMNKMPKVQAFLSHMEASTTAVKAIPSKHVNMVVGRECDIGFFADPDQLVITILTGVTGSHKSNLCQTLTAMAKEDSRWAVLRPPPDQPMQQFSPSQLQATLSATWRAYRVRKSTKKMRALVVAPGFTDTVDIVQAISCHPDKLVSNHLCIGAVTACVDPQNVYLRNHYALPKLFEQCAHGWVNNIVFTACTEPQKREVHPDLERIQNTIRAINPNVALLLADKGKVTRSTDIDMILSTDAFNSDELLRARYLSCPGWYFGLFDTGDIFPEMNEVYVKFKHPLDKNRFTSRMRRANINLRNFPFTGNIYMIRGKVMFEKDFNIYNVQHTVLSKDYSLEPCEPGKDGNVFLIFTGIQLEVSQLQLWIKQCVPFRPQKRVIRELSSLTRTEKARIEKKRHGDPLPEGWFYNGCQFVSLTGDRENTHPLLQQFIEEYLAAENEKAEKYNASLGDGNYDDLFD